MTAPTILTVGQSQTIPDTTFDDLQLRRLLSDKTIRILSHPAETPDGKKNEIIARQEIFRLMRDPDKYARIKACYVELKEYERAVRLWRASAVAVEKRYLFSEALAGFASICKTLGTLSEVGDSTRFAALSAYWREILSAQGALEADIASLKAILARAGKCNLSMGERYFLTRDDVPQTVYDELVTAAEELGLDIPERKNTRIRLNDAISNAVAELYPDEMAQCDSYIEKYKDLPFDAPSSYIAEFDFFYSVLALCEKADEKGIPLCYPTVADKRQYLAKKVYDISLFIKDADRIVPNDTYFSAEEPFFFITGANGGGKTTYLRASGINLILFLGGCPIFAEDAEIYPFTSVLTHFPADERFTSGGRLEEEQMRVNYLLNTCNADTFIVFNETYSGTDDKMGCEMTLDTASKIKEKQTFGLFVTHFHEVRAGGWPMLNTVIEEDEYHRRTFRIVRDFGITSSCADDILRKYRLDRVSRSERGVGA